MTTKIQAEVADDADFVLESEVGVADGVAGLDGSGKVPAAQLPPGATGALSYQGTWNATTNSPVLASGAGTQGHYYVVSVQGTTTIDGINDWEVTDWIVFNGSVWEKADNTDKVASVHGRTGAVVAAASDYDASEVDNDSGVTGSKVSDALDTLDSGKSATGHGHTLADISDDGALAALNTVGSAEIDAGAVGNTKLADMAQATVKGRADGAGTGEPTDLTPAQARTVLNVADNANNYSHPNHTGDVTSTGDGATVIAANAVTNAKRATLAADRIRGRANGGGAGDTEDLTPAQVRTILNVADGATAEVAATTSTAGVVELATQAEMETATDTGRVPSVSVLQNHPGIAKVWVTVDMTGTAAILDSYNMTSITDNGVGDMTLTFATDFSDTKYSLVSGSWFDGAETGWLVDTLSTRAVGSVDILVVDGIFAEIDGDFNSIAIFGDQ